MRGNKIHADLMCKKIGTILLKEWDPIGVRDIPEAQDEYDAYVFLVYNLIISGKTKRQIFDYLWRIQTENMGLSGNKEKTELVASILWDQIFGEIL